MSSLTAQVDALNAKLAAHIKLMGDMQTKSAFMANLGQGYKQAVDASGAFNTQMVKMGASVDQFGAKLAKNQLSLTQYKRALRESRGQMRTGEVNELANAQARMRASTVFNQGGGQYLVSTPRKLDLSGPQGATNAINLANEKARIHQSLIQGINQKYVNWGKNTQWAGRQLTVGFTVPLVIFGGLASKIFRDADAQLTKLKKVYGSGIEKTTAEDLEKISKEVMNLSQALSEARGGNLNEILETASDIAATGKTGQELLDTLDQTNRFSILGDIDRQTAIKSTLAIQTAFGKNTQELTETIDFLNAAENSTSLSMNDMAEAIPRAGTVVKGLGGDIEDLTLYMVAMREGGIDAAEGANGLKSGLASIINPSTKAKKILQGFGIDLEAIVQTNKGQLTPTILALKEELDGLDDLARSQSITALFGKYQFARMSALFNNINSEGSQTKQIFDLIGKSASELADVSAGELKTKTESLSVRYERAVNAVKNALIPIGETFTKIAIPVLNFVTKLLDAFNKMPDFIKGAVVAIGVLIAAVGPLLMLMGQFLNLFGNVKQGFNSMGNVVRKAMGRETRTFEGALTPEMMAHEASLKKDSTAVQEHALAVDAMSNVIKTLTNGLMSASRPFIGSAADPTGAGGTFLGGRLRGATDSASVKKPDINQQYATQLLASALMGGDAMIGPLGANMTTVRDTPVYPKNWKETGVTGNDFNNLAAQIELLDAQLAADLRTAAAGIDFGRTGENFGAYSHVYADQKGNSPLHAFIENQLPNTQRSNDTNPNVKPGELRPGFAPAMDRSLDMIQRGGGAALYAEALRNPQLMNGLKITAAMQASKTVEEFEHLMLAMSGETAEAIQETKARITQLGDQAKARIDAQLTRNGLTAIPGVAAPEEPKPKAPTTPVVQPGAPFKTRTVVGNGTAAGQTVVAGRGGREVETQARVTRANTLIQGEWTEALKKKVGASQVELIQIRDVTTSTGEVVRVMDLIDKEGTILATAMRTASGKLGLPMGGVLGKGTGVGSSAYPASMPVPAYVSTTAPSAVADLRREIDRGEARQREADRKMQDAADRSARARRAGPASLVPVVSTAGWQTVRQSADQIAASAARAAEGTEKVRSNISGAASGIGMLASTMLMFVGNTNSAAVQFAFMASTALTMAPILGQMIPKSAKASFASNFVAPILTGLGSIKAGVLKVLPGLASLGPALLNPYTAAVAAVVLVTAFFIKKQKDAITAARKQAEDYANAVKTTAGATQDLIERNGEIIKIVGPNGVVNQAARGWDDYALKISGVRQASKSYIEQVKGDNEDLIKSLSALNPEDLRRRLTDIYQGLIINGATDDQAKTFLDSLGLLLDKRAVTVDVILKMKGWSDKDPIDLLKDQAANAANALPEGVDLSKQTSGALIPGSEESTGVAQYTNFTGLFLADEVGKAKPKFEAAGAELGKVLADGISAGILTPQGPETETMLVESFNKIKANVIQATKGEEVLANMLTIPELGPQITKVFTDVGVPIEQGVAGLVEKFLNLDRAGRENLMNTLMALGPEGKSLANTLFTAQGATDAMTVSLSAGNAGLKQVIDTAGQNGNITGYAASLYAVRNASDALATTGDQLNELFKRQNQAFRDQFFAKAQKYIDDYAKNVKKRNQEMVESAREAAQAQLKAVRDGEKKKMDALRKAQQKKQDKAQDNIDAMRKRYDDQIDKINELEEARKKAFEAEKERLRRLTEQRNFDIDYAEAVANGDLFGAARIRNEQDAAKKSYALDDKDMAAEDATAKKIGLIEKERDAKIDAAEKALEKMKEADAAALESAQAASDARIEAAEKASQRAIDAAEKAAERSNAAAEKAVDGLKAVSKQAQDEWDAAIAAGENGLAVAQKWGPKLGVPAATATAMFKANASQWAPLVAGGLNKAATDPKVAVAARLVGINATANMLGLTTTAAERKYLSSGGVDLGEYFGYRLQGLSWNTIRMAMGAPGGGGPESKNAPGRWTGGPVSRGMPYMVGENGHEIFVPESNGRIINNTDVKRLGREGGKGGSEGGMWGFGLGMGLANLAAERAGGVLADYLKNRAQPGMPSGPPGGYGPVTEGNGIFDGRFSYPFSSPFRISSPFGYRNSPHGYGRMFHSGTDIAAPMGTPIKAIGGGIAQSVGWDPAKDPRGRPWLGQRVIMNHGGGWASYYGHMSEYRIKEGMRVSEGQTIGMVGSTGASTGPHLHLTIKQGGKLVNPSMVIPGLMRGAKINYDNTLANLHRGETVLTAPITSKFEALANSLAGGKGGGYGDINVNFYGDVNSEVDVEAGVTAALDKRDVRMGRTRKVG
jgi:TP901 family phage tail tape measure protein